MERLIVVGRCGLGFEEMKKLQKQEFEEVRQTLRNDYLCGQADK